MIETLLDLSLTTFVAGVFVLLTFSSEVGFWVGRFVARAYFGKPGALSDLIDGNVGTIVNASLGLLALLLGFTFSSAMTHFEQNRQAVIAEAAAISSALQYATLQPAPFDSTISRQIRDYANIRFSLTRGPATAKTVRETQANSSRAADVIWQSIGGLNRAAPGNVLVQNLATAVGKMRGAGLTLSEYLVSGIPKGLFVPVGFFVIFNAVLLGVCMGEGKRRHLLQAWGLYFLVALAVGIIVDLDRPLAGLINVDLQAMLAMADHL